MQQLPLTLESLLQVQRTAPLHWVIDTAPFFLGLFASFAGRRQDRLLRLNVELEQRVQEREQMLRQLEVLQTGMEQRTRDLGRRAVLLAAAADVGRAAASILELELLARQVVELVRERFALYYVGLFLLDVTGEYAVLEAGTGEAGRLMKEQGHRLAVDDASMVGKACVQRQACIVQGTGAEKVRSFDDPLLPDTQSQIALPLIVGDRVLGALDVQSAQPAAFPEQDIAVLQLVADQVAVAVDNARKVAGETTLLEATSPVYRVSRRLAAATTTDEVAAAITDSVAETEADGCVIVEFEFSPTGEPEALLYLGVWRRDREPQFQPGMRLPFARSPFPLEMVSIPWVVTNVELDERLPQSAREVFGATGTRALANIPLHRGERVFGQVVALRNVPGPFSDASLRLYEAISDQASMAIERARLLEEAQRRGARDRLVGEIADKMRRAVDMDSLLQITIQEMATALSAPSTLVQFSMQPEAIAEDDKGRQSPIA